MAARRFVWFGLVLPLTVACAASEGASDGSSVFGQNPDYGGQTGALLPPIDPDACGPRLGPDQVLTLSAEDPGFVALGARLGLDSGANDAGVADSGADDGNSGADGGNSGADGGNSGATPTNDWELADTSGEAISLAPEANGDTTVFRPRASLAPGSYTLSYSCAGVTRTVPVSVVDPLPSTAPAPKLVESVQLAYDPSQFTCTSITQRVTLILTLSAERLAFADTTQLSLRGSGVDVVIAPYASIDAREPTLQIGVPICGASVTPGCLLPQALELSLVSEVLNDPAATTTLPLTIDAACLPETAPAQAESEASNDEPTPRCSLVQRGAGSPYSLVWLTAIAVGFVIRREARRRGEAVLPWRGVCRGSRRRPSRCP